MDKTPTKNRTTEKGAVQMSNTDPSVEINNMTQNIILKIDPDTKYIYAKVAGRTPGYGSLYLNGIKINISTTVFTQIYPG